MATSSPRPTHPARLSRVVASGLTAAVTVGAVAAMTASAAQDTVDEVGSAIGDVTRHEAEVAVAAMMAAADAGDDVAPTTAPPRIATAGVS